MDKSDAQNLLGGDEWYERFREYLNDAIELVGLTKEGVSRIRTLPKLMDLLSPHIEESNDPEVLEQDRVQREHMAHTADLALKAQDTDFALLHAHTLMGLWGALEAAVQDLAITRLVEDPGLLSGQAFERLRVPVSALSLSPWDRARSIILTLQREQGGEASLGTGQFEKLLKAVGLGGAYAPRVRRALVLAQQYRHLVAHRGGRADQQFMDACPQIPIQSGEQVQLSTDQFYEMVSAVGVYAVALMDRYRVTNGKKPWSSAESAAKLDADWFVDETRGLEQ